MNRAIVLGVVVVFLGSGEALAQKPEAVALKNKGDHYLATGEPKKAVAAYRRAIEVDPSYKEGYGALAAHFLRKREYAQAVKVLKSGLARFPDHPDGWYNLAYALRKQGKLDAAVTAYRHFARLRPRSPDPYYGIGLALQAKGDLKGAAESFRRYAELEKNPAKEVWVEKARQLAEKLAKKAGVTTPKPVAKKPTPTERKEGAKPRRGVGRSRAEPGEKKRAARNAGRPIPRHATLPPSGTHSHTDDTPVTPQRERAMKLKAEGDRLVRAGRQAEAVGKYQQAIKVDYSYAAAYNELGTTLFALKRYEQAIRVFRIAIRDNPDYHLGWYNLAYALRKAGRLLPAISAYKRFIQVRPNDPDPYFGLGLAEKAAGNNAGAVSAFKRYIKLERRQSQEKWVHKARVEVATLEGRQPPPYVPGKVITAEPAKPKVPLTRAERRRLARAEAKRKREEARRERAEARKAKLEAARLAREEARRKREEARRERAEARKAKLEAARLAREERRRKRAEARKAKLEAARLAREDRKLVVLGARPPAASMAPTPAPSAAGPDLSGFQPAPDVIVSPPMPGPPGPPPGSSSGRLRVHGDTLARTGKFRAAAKAYVQAVRSDPFNTRAYDGLAYCAFKLGAHRAGARRLSIALRDNPDYHQGWLHQARLYRGAKDNVKAVGSYRRYLAAKPDAAAVRLELARTLRTLGMQSQAVQELKKVMRPRRVKGNEPLILAARAELRGLGVTPPGLRVAARRAAGSTVVATAPRKKTSAELRAEARKARLEARRLAKEERQRKLAEARRKAAEARQRAREERKRKLEERREALLEKRRKAAEARKAKIEAARLARQERRRALAEKRRQRAEARRMARLARRRGKGKRAAGTGLAEAVGGDMAEAMPPVPPRRRMHDVLQPAPDAATGLTRVADAQFAAKRYVVALGIYQQAARLDPASTGPLYRAGVAAVALGRMHLAADLFRQVLRVDPGNGTARVNLEMALAAAKSQKPTAAYLASAREGVRASLDRGRYAAAEREASSLLGKTVSPEVHLLRAEARLAQRKPRQALADGGRALALDPGSAVALRVMGDAHRQLGHRNKALYYYRLFLARAGDAGDPGTRAQIKQLVSDLASAK
jgi:tetratricopeptide (TPR) repeat protein